MWKNIEKVLTFNGLFILLGILGGLSSILTIFIDNFDININLKWLIFYTYVSFMIVTLLLKVIYDLSKKIINLKPNFSISAVSYISSAEILIGEKTDWIGLDTFVTIYYKDNEFVTELGYGYISQVGESSIQIKLLKFAEYFETHFADKLDELTNSNINIINRLEIKATITYSKINIYERNR
jgi:hypothetical protein